MVLARRLFGWIRRVRLPKQEPNCFTVFNYFAGGLALTVSTTYTVTGSWLADNGLHLSMPVLVLILVVVVTPMYYVVLKDDHDERPA